MLQRSTHESAVDVPAIPATVQPGETVDHPDLIAGFEPVVETPADVDPAQVPDAAPKSIKQRAAASADIPKE